MNMIWNDRQGRLSPLKATTFLVAIAPAIVITYWFFNGALQPLSVKNAIHLTGDWAVRFLVLTLALTPFQRVFNYPKIALVRRMLGVTAFSYALAHFILYLINVKWNFSFATSEIINRFYLTIGFVTLLGLSALAATSFDGALRKLGTKWKMLHRLAYGLAVLAVFHYYLQSKIDVSAATLMAGLFLLAMTVRVMIARRVALTPLVLGGAAIIACALTALTEFIWYALATGVNPMRVLKANIMLSNGIRPAVLILLVGLALSILAYARQWQVTVNRQSASR